MSRRQTFTNIAKDRVFNNLSVNDASKVPIVNGLPDVNGKVGDVVFDTVTNDFYGCTNSGWEILSGGGGTTGPTGATGPAGSGGENLFQTLTIGNSAGGLEIVELERLIFSGLTGTVRIGKDTGLVSQGSNSVAIGNSAATTLQGTESVAIGFEAGSNRQGTESVAIGAFAGQTSQDLNAVAIGSLAGL
jgi:hypothetical protein